MRDSLPPHDDTSVHRPWTKTADGRMRVHYKDRALADTAYATYPVPDPAAGEKTLDHRVDALVAAQRQATPVIICPAAHRAESGIQ